MEKELIKIPKATLDFYKYYKDGIVYYEFDATECSPPEPMVNTIVALNILKNENERVVGIYFHEPFPLYERISSDYMYESQELSNGDFRVVFRKKH
jgi:hypothetical protein